jgi:Fe2+ transport system protein FeoA
MTEAVLHEKAVIKRVHELAEYNLELLAFLEGKGLVPGAEVIVREILPFNQTITLESDGQMVTLGYASARYVFVDLLS